MANIAKISAQKFAHGGIVGGSSYTGDRVPAMVNSGEMVLTRGQQANLFNTINNNSNMSNAVNINISTGGGSYDMAAAKHTVDSLVPVLGSALVRARREGRLVEYENAR